MKDDFIKNIRQKFQKDVAKLQNDAYNHIINNLLVNNIKGNQKIYSITGYDSESNMRSLIIPGCIYIMQYDAKKPVNYKFNGKIIQFSDAEPLVLITSVNGKIVKGINLNLCNAALKAIILNIFYNMDNMFFEETAEKLTSKGQPALSNNIMLFLSKPNAEDTINNYLLHIYKINSYNVIFRNYNIDQIKKIRLVEPWQWEEIPMLNYNGTIKKDILDNIHKITGINTIKNI